MSARRQSAGTALPVVWSEWHVQHDTTQLPVAADVRRPSAGYPYRLHELPQRVDRIMQALSDTLHIKILKPVDAGLDPILAVHDEGYVTFLREHQARAGDGKSGDAPLYPSTFPTRPVNHPPAHPLALFGSYAFDCFSPLLPGTWEAAYWSAQCAATAADLVAAGELVSYALCRPPGHHAGPDYCGGLCYLNNASIAARRLQMGGERVAILDIDYHHGNGTQDIFYSDASVLYCSLHVDPVAGYPYFWGYADEVGHGAAASANRNWPLAPGTTFEEYRCALQEALDEIAAWRATVLVVAAGFDTAEGDPLGQFALSRDDFSEAGKLVASAAVPIVVIQEGGYDLERLGGYALAFLASLMAATRAHE